MDSVIAASFAVMFLAAVFSGNRLYSGLRQTKNKDAKITLCLKGIFFGFLLSVAVTFIQYAVLAVFGKKWQVVWPGVLILQFSWLVFGNVLTRTIFE